MINSKVKQQKGKGKRKKTKFVKIVFRIPMSRKKQLERYCVANDTTPRIALRKIINTYLDENAPAISTKVVPKNQLKLFDLKDYDHGGIQTQMDL
jgi:hypothetical protein